MLLNISFMYASRESVNCGSGEVRLHSSSITLTTSYCCYSVLTVPSVSYKKETTFWYTYPMKFLLVFLISISECIRVTSFAPASTSIPPLYPRSPSVREPTTSNVGAAMYVSRRDVMINTGLLGCIQLTGLSRPAYAAATTAKGSMADPVSTITSARETLQKLLDNWEKAVIDCTFADVPRELLEQKNKEALLEKASTFALFDKSVSVETCKTTNRVVRDYLGATGIGPVVGLEKQMKQALDRVNPDFLDEYVTEIELIEQSLAKARSLAYTAGVADFNSVNNFEKDQVTAVLSDNSNLEQTRLSIAQVVVGLQKIETMFE